MRTHRIALLLAVIAAICIAPNTTASDGTADGDSRLVAYYFHTDFRCSTCKKIESYSTEAITEGFADELEKKTLEWRIVNTDRKEHQHFVEDFELVTKSLVLVEYEGDEVKRFKNLKLIWKLVGDKDGFITYVRNETRDFRESP